MKFSRFALSCFVVLTVFALLCVFYEGPAPAVSLSQSGKQLLFTINNVSVNEIAMNSGESGIVYFAQWTILGGILETKEGVGHTPPGSYIHGFARLSPHESITERTAIPAGATHVTVTLYYAPITRYNHIAEVLSQEYHNDILSRIRLFDRGRERHIKIEAGLFP